MNAFRRWRWAAALLLLSTACALSPYDVVVPLQQTLSAAGQSATPVLQPTPAVVTTPLPVILEPSPTGTASPSPQPSPTLTSTPLPGEAVVTIINHTPYTVYVNLQGSRNYSYVLPAAGRYEASLAPGAYHFRWIVSGEQAARGAVTFPDGPSTWEIYDTPSLVDSPTPLWEVSPMWTSMP